MGLLGAHVAQQKAQIGLVGVGGGHAGVGVHIVVHGDVVIAVGGDGHVPLAQQGVDKAVDQSAVVVILLHDELGHIQGVHPGGDLLVILALAGDGVHQHCALDVRAPEQADGLYHPGGDPPGVAVLVDLKLRGGEHHGGVVEAQVPDDVPVQRLGEGVFHPLGQAGDGGLLGDHVHHHIGGQALAAVGQPLEQVGIGNGSHPHRTALIVDLGGVAGVLELADHVAEGAHLPVPQEFGGGAVQGGDLVEGDLGHVRGKVPGLHRQQVPIGRRPEQGHGDDVAHSGYHDHRDKQQSHRQTAALDEFQPLAELLLGGADHVVMGCAGQEKDADDVYGAQQTEKAVELPGVGVQGGQGDIEIPKAHRRRHRQAEQGAPKLTFGQAYSIV